MYDTLKPGGSRTANTPSSSNVTYRLIFVLIVGSMESISRQNLYLTIIFFMISRFSVFAVITQTVFLIVLKHLFGLRGYATNRIIDVCVCVFRYVCNSNNTKNFQHTHTKPESYMYECIGGSRRRQRWRL